MLSKTKKRRLPVAIRVSLWYTGFILFLFSSILFFSLFITNRYIETRTEKNLIESVQEVSKNLADFEGFDNGVYFILYDENMEIIGGSFPKEFDSKLGISDSKIASFKGKNVDYFYYDMEFLSHKGIWIRGILPIQRSHNEMYRFLLIALVIGPFIFAIIIYGGYKIVKNAFKPVDDISSTALEIKDKKDFSKRIDIDAGNDEIHIMANVFNQMLDSLENSYIHEKQFSSDVSHELRTPISVILAESEYALEYCKDIDEAKESFEVIKRQSNRMGLLINQILEMTRLEKIDDVKPTIMDLSELLENSIKDYSGKFKEKGIYLTKNIEEKIYIKAQSTMISRMIDNLVSNAIKFTKDKIEINLHQDSSNIVLEVIDNGIGISKEDLNRIWDRFYQTDSSRNKDKNSGYGLGLYLVYRIAQIHGAKLEVESELGKGSTFRVIFQKIQNI